MRGIKGLPLLLIGLIALQSMAAAVDVHPLHPSESDGTAHLVDERVSPETDTAEFLSERDSGTSLDCQQCCHCHSVQLYYLPFPHPAPPAPLHLRQEGGYPLSLHTGQRTRLYRPPIA